MIQVAHQPHHDPERGPGQQHEGNAQRERALKALRGIGTCSGSDEQQPDGGAQSQPPKTEPDERESRAEDAADDDRSKQRRGEPCENVVVVG